MTKKTIVYIVSIMLFLSCKANNNANTISKGKELAKEEKQVIENKFYAFKKILNEQLEKKGTLFSVEKYLNEKFIYFNDFEEENKNYYYKGNSKNLELIDKKININKLLATLKKGDARFAVPIANIGYKKGYPIIDFIYNFDNSTWEIEAIRYEKY